MVVVAFRIAHSEKCSQFIRAPYERRCLAAAALSTSGQTLWTLSYSCIFLSERSDSSAEPQTAAVAFSLSLSPALCMSPFLSFSLIELLFLENIVKHPRRTAAPLSSTSRWHLAVTLEAAPCLSSLFATTTTTTADTFHNHSVCQPKQQQRHQHKTATQKYHLFHLLITLLIAQHSLT